MDLDHALAERARRQHGVFNVRQARDLGFTSTMTRTRRQQGRWLTLAPRVFIINGTPVTWHAKVLAACLSTGGVASHRTAAALHRVRGFEPGRVEVSVARPVQRWPPNATVHRSKDLHRFGPITLDGIPSTPVPRLVVDLGAVVSFQRFETAVDDLLGRKLLTWDDAVLALSAHSRQGRNGCGPLRSLLLERYGEHLPESVLERIFLRLLVDRGLRQPVPQHEIHDQRGFIARVDFAYPDHAIAIELDSVRYHLDAITFERDHAKRSRLMAAGWTVLAFTWQMVVGDPVGVVRTIEKVLTRAAA